MGGVRIAIGEAAGPCLAIFHLGGRGHKFYHKIAVFVQNHRARVLEDPLIVGLAIDPIEERCALANEAPKVIELLITALR
jgi:hypothetical protein